MKRIGILAMGLILGALVLCVVHQDAKAQGTVNGPQFYTIRGYVKDTLQGVSAHTADTLKLAQSSAKYTRIKVVPRNGSSDTLTAITGGRTGGIYLFETASKDTSIGFYKGANLKIPSTVVLSDTNDILLLWYDGTFWRQLSSSANH